uniref:NET domain-containing protein n=1 Tax=Panagrellus redivivus TaxID=6233 RepID=A0A7E4VA86_PANRE
MSQVQKPKRIAIFDENKSTPAPQARSKSALKPSSIIATPRTPGIMMRNPNTTQIKPLDFSEAESSPQTAKTNISTPSVQPKPAPSSVKPKTKSKPAASTPYATYERLNPAEYGGEFAGLVDLLQRVFPDRDELDTCTKHHIDDVEDWETHERDLCKNIVMLESPEQSINGDTSLSDDSGVDYDVFLSEKNKENHAPMVGPGGDADFDYDPDAPEEIVLFEPVNFD